MMLCLHVDGYFLLLCNSSSDVCESMKVSVSQ